MKMSALRIEHLDEVLPWIDGRREFVVKRAPEYTAIDYQINFSDTFDDARRVELRGIKFKPTGEIMARPLHKFFNLGERLDTQASAISLDAEHVIMDKLDGSMIHPAILPDGSIRFMTRMGVTNVAEKAERHLTEQLRDAVGALLMDGYTPTFEFTAPDNRIVIQYAVSALTLLAIRNTVTGVYQPRAFLEGWAESAGVRVVRVWERPSTTQELIERVATLRGAEGIVLQMGSGLWLKIKGAEYVQMHKAKDGIGHEKNVLAAILDGMQDDLKQLLVDEDRKRFDDYELALSAALLKSAGQIETAVTSGAHLDQKAFAVEHLAGAPQWLRNTAFSVRSGKVTALESIRQFMRKHCGTQTDVDLIRPLIGTTWQATAAPE